MKPWQERFKSKVMWLDDGDDSCLIWVGALRDDGRGRFWLHGEECRAHRVAWQIFNGDPIPEGYRLIQECSHPQCVRHWRLDRPDRKLTMEQVRQIRASNRPGAALAVQYGVSWSYIRRIKCGAERTDGTEHTDSGSVCA